MAWEINISAQGWVEIREKLNEWDKESLIAAIADDKFEHVYGMAGFDHANRACEAEKQRLADLPLDLFADRAFQLIEQNNTCENGGHGFWIDREGFHVVFLE